MPTQELDAKSSHPSFERAENQKINCTDATDEGASYRQYFLISLILFVHLISQAGWICADKVRALFFKGTFTSEFSRITS